MYVHADLELQCLHVIFNAACFYLERFVIFKEQRLREREPQFFIVKFISYTHALR